MERVPQQRRNSLVSLARSDCRKGRDQIRALSLLATIRRNKHLKDTLPIIPYQASQPKHRPKCDRRPHSCRPGIIVQALGKNETRERWNYGPQKGYNVSSVSIVGSLAGGEVIHTYKIGEAQGRPVPRT